MGHNKPIVAVPIDNVAQVSKQVSEQTAAQISKQVSEQTAAQVAARIASESANNAAQTAAQVSEQTAAQVAARIASESANNAVQVSEQTAAQTAAQVAARIASETTNNVLTETFVNNNRIPNTFTNSVKHVAQREKFTQIEPYNRNLEGVDIGAKGCGCDDCECTDCYKNLNDQINLGVNNYIFPNCNNDYMCLNGCNIHDQINSYQFDYRMGQSATELERSRSGMYTSLNVDSCSQECPSMGWMPPMTTERAAAAEYISTLEPIKKN